MKITATRTTAAIAGIWITGGQILVLRLGGGDSPLLFLVAAIIFLVIPGAVFVIGLEHYRRWGWTFWRMSHFKRFGNQQYWADTKQVFFRLLYWFAAGTATLMVYSRVFAVQDP